MSNVSIARKPLVASLLAALGLTILSASAMAADYPQRVAIGQLSAKYSLGVSEAPLLRRDAGPGQGVATDLLIKELAASSDAINTRGDFKIERGANKTNVIGTGWRLTVLGDGTQVKYRNYDYLDSANNKPLPVASRLSQAQLEKLGREFIATKLGRYVALGKNEALVPYFTEFQVGGGGSTIPGAKPAEEQVFANTVIFARSVNGIPVIGPGSKIAVTFANDGRAAGFDYDWASYQQTGGIQKVASPTEVQSRVRKLLPVDLAASDVKTTRVECGYFDLGARKRDVNAPVQTACLVHAHKRQIVDKVAYAEDPNSGHTIAAIMSPIPAGATIERDTSWPQALKLLGITPPNADVPGDIRR